MQKEQNWYYESEGHQKGPFSLSELQERFKERRLSAQTKVWNAQMTEWVEAAKVEEFSHIVLTQPRQQRMVRFAKLRTANATEAVLTDALSLEFFDSHSSRIATFRERTIALSIDLGLLSVVIYLLLSLDVPIIRTLKRDTLLYAIPSLSFVFAMIGWIYFAFAEYIFQGSIGKRFMKLKIVNDIGNNASFEQLTGRYFVKIFSILAFGIGCLMMLKSRKGQTLHDRFAKTMVKSKNRH